MGALQYIYISYTHKAVERGFLVILLTWNPVKEKSSKVVLVLPMERVHPPAKMSICAINCN